MESDPDRLIGSRCLLMWYNRVKSLWHFFFKFRRLRTKRCSLAQRDMCTMQQDLHKADDIDYNPEDGCCVLQVVLQNFVSLPPTVMGQVLAQTSVSVGHGMRFHKVKLIFSSEYVDANNKNALASGTTLMLDPVLNMHICHWWSPKYPHYRRWVYRLSLLPCWWWGFQFVNFIINFVTMWNTFRLCQLTGTSKHFLWSCGPSLQNSGIIHFHVLACKYYTGWCMLQTSMNFWLWIFYIERMFMND